MRGRAASSHFARGLAFTIATFAPFSLCAPAQTNTDICREYAVTTLEVLKGASFGTGDGKPWFLRQDELIRLDADQNRLIPVPMGDTNWFSNHPTLVLRRIQVRPAGADNEH